MPAPTYLLDTNVVLHLVRGNDFAAYLADAFGLLDPPTRPLVSIVSHGELWAIADRNQWGANRRKELEELLDMLSYVSLDDQSVIAAYVDLRRASRQSGNTLSDNDTWIAACAKAAEATLLTSDTDFKAVPSTVCSVQHVEPSAWIS